MGNGASSRNSFFDACVSRRSLLISAGGAISLLGLAACASPGSSGEGGKKTLTFWVISSFTEAQDNELLKSLQQYTKENGVDVVLESFSPGDFKDKYLTAAISGGGPDVAAIDSAWTAELAAAGVITDISGDWSGISSEYLEGSAATANVDGAQYAVPWYANNVALYYNKTMFAEAGIAAPPTTWEEFRAASQALTGGDKYGFMLGSAWFGPFLWWSFLWQNGGEVLSADNKSAAFADAAGIEAWEFYANLYLKDKVVPEEFLGVNAGWDGYWTPFLQGRVGMMMVGDWAIWSLRDAAPNLDFGIVPLPMGKNSATIVGGYNLAVSTKSEDQEGGVALIKWLTDAGRDDMLASYDRMPARNDVTDSPQFNSGERAAFAQQADVARARPVIAQWSALENDFMAKAWDETIRGTKAPAAALKVAAEAVNSALGK